MLDGRRPLGGDRVRAHAAARRRRADRERSRERTPGRELLRTRRAGVVGALALGFARVDPTQAAFAYLTAWAFAVSIALGALIFVMIGHAMSATWTALFQRQAELVVGDAAGARGAVRADRRVGCRSSTRGCTAPPHEVELARARGPSRGVAERAVLDRTRGVLSGVLDGRSASACARRPSTAFACAMFVPLGLTSTFAAFDWLMSLDALLGLDGLRPDLLRRRLRRRVRAARGDHLARDPPRHTGALGAHDVRVPDLLAYVEFAQGFIIWIANKPDEVPWYVTRAAGGWGTLLALLALGGFVVPFFALLPRDLSRNPRWVAAVGRWLLVLHYLDIYWLVMPVLHRLPEIHWLDLGAPCAVLGIAAVVALVRRPPAFATDDPRVIAARTYRGNDV